MFISICLYFQQKWNFGRNFCYEMTLRGNFEEKRVKIKKVVCKPPTVFNPLLIYEKKNFFSWTLNDAKIFPFLCFLTSVEISAMAATVLGLRGGMSVSEKKIFFFSNTYMIGVLKSKTGIWIASTQNEYFEFENN